MSPRLIAVLMLAVSATVMATETTTEAVVEEMQTETEAAAGEAKVAAEEMTEEAAQEAEAVVEQAQTTAGEMTQEAEAAAEETAGEATQEAEAVAEEATQETGAAAEEAEAAAQETAEEATQEAEGEQTADSSDIQAKLAACAACHGADGNSVIPQNPKLAGQVPGFIADQLMKFKSGERENAIMAAQVANLSDEDMLAIDDFYVAQQPQLGAITEDMQEQALTGEKIYRGGEPSMSISACMSCHGPSGKGIPIRFPRVSGQHVDYLESTLLAYKSGARASDVMNSIAFRLSEQQIKSLAMYMHGLK